MKSQYLKPYQSHVLTQLAIGKRPLSVGTFLTYRLRGNAKNWSGRYLGSLKRGLEKEGWVETKSILGGVAYQPPNLL
jgi:hypothetical protein